jgi:hypothetical protein
MLLAAGCAEQITSTTPPMATIIKNTNIFFLNPATFKDTSKQLHAVL